MNTYPPGPLEEHIGNLVKQIRRFFPDLDLSSLLFFDELDCITTEKGRFIEKENLMSVDEFKNFFEKLCRQGREWINLSGDSWLNNHFLVAIEYSQRVGYPMTAIVISGPTLDSDNRPLIQTRLKVL
ncbi:MAG: hypothetical protein MN733_06615 [Nitrososphaera sp.]|nr:hypothetical protein [Nitrososphaera sp.]